jgi:hypothetical protein
MLLLELKRVDLDAIDLDEAVTALAFAETVANKYKDLELPAPDWLTDKVAGLRREVDNRHRDLLEMRLRQARTRRDQLRTREERVQGIDAEIADLQKRLGQG